jgi:ABC-2 type transport system permease protein
VSESEGGVSAERFARLAEAPLTVVGAPAMSGARSFVTPVRDLFGHRELLGLLVRRDLKAKYKDSALGFLWSLARPLMQLAIYYIVLGQFLQAARGIPDFAIYIFTGLTIMGLFSETLVGATGAVIANAALVKKVYVPRELFPLASVGSALFNFSIQLGILVVATVVSGSFPWHAELLYAIPSVLIVLIYALGFGLFLAAANVYLRDVQYLVEVAMMVLFWASPVVYSWQMVSERVTNSLVLELYTNNPLTLAVIGFQRAFWIESDSVAQPADLLLRMTIAIGVGLVILIGSHRIFLRLQGDFAQEL